MVQRNWKTSEEFKEAVQTYETIQQRERYVSLMDDTFIGFLPPNLRQYLRQGGRSLHADFYSKGVKSNTADYHWDGNSWVLQYVPDRSKCLR